MQTLNEKKNVYLFCPKNVLNQSVLLRIGIQQYMIFPIIFYYLTIHSDVPLSLLILIICAFSIFFYYCQGFITVYIYSNDQLLVLVIFDADPGPWDPCVVAAMDKFTDYQVLWRKRDGMATLSKGEQPDPCLHRLFIAFLGTLH